MTLLLLFRSASTGDDPPFGSTENRAIMAGVVASAQPIIPAPYFGAGQALHPKKLAPQLTAVQVDEPPYTQRDEFNHIAVMWRVPDPLPYFGAGQALELKKLSPGIPGQSADNPPVMGGASYVQRATILDLNQPPPPNPFIGGWQALQPRWINPTLSAVPEDNPPFSNTGRMSVHHAIATYPWIPAPPLPTLNVKYTEAYTEPYKPHLQLVELHEIIRLSQAPDPHPFIGGRQALEPRKLPPALIAVQVDEPPYTQRGRLMSTATIIDLNQPPPPSPYMGGWQWLQRGRLPVSVIEIPVNDPPFSRQSWTARNASIVSQNQTPPLWPFIGGRQPFEPIKLPPAISGFVIVVDSPPFNRSSAFWTVQAAWVPTPPLPWRPRPSIAPFTPFGGTITVVWPADIPQFALMKTLSETQEDNYVRFTPEVGPPKDRSAASVTNDLVSFDTLMTSPEWTRFMVFYRTTTKSGTVPFLMKNPRTQTQETFVFYENPKATVWHGTTLKVTLNFRKKS